MVDVCHGVTECDRALALDVLLSWIAKLKDILQLDSVGKELRPFLNDDLIIGTFFRKSQDSLESLPNSTNFFGVRHASDFRHHMDLCCFGGG